MKKSYPGIPECFYRVSAKAIVQDKQGKCMLCLDDSGYWDFPGGGIDHGENTKEALEREVMEEMGLKIVSSSSQPVYIYIAQSTKGNIPVCIMCYSTKLEHYDFSSSDECREIGWFDLKQAQDIITYPENLDIIEYLEKQED